MRFYRPLEPTGLRRPRRALAALLAVAALTAAAAHDPIPPEARAYLANPRYDVMAVAILQISNAGATNEFPPDGVMRLEQTLRGSLRANAAYNFRLEAARRALDHELEGGRLRAEWYRRPFHGPREGERLIVFARVSENPLGRESVVVLEGPWLTDTPDMRAAARAAMQPVERTPWVQTLLLALVLLAPVAGVVLLALDWRLRGRGFTPRHAAAAAAQVAAFALYAIYESGVRAPVAARGDLPLLLPALVISAILLILLAPRLAEGYRGSPSL